MDLPKTVDVNVEDVFSLERKSVEIVLSRVKSFIKLSEERKEKVEPVDLDDV